MTFQSLTDSSLSNSVTLEKRVQTQDNPPFLSLSPRHTNTLKVIPHLSDKNVPVRWSPDLFLSVFEPVATFSEVDSRVFWSEMFFEPVVCDVISSWRR